MALTDGHGQRLLGSSDIVDFKWIVAIDFGTHGTGLGYAKIPKTQAEQEEKAELYIEQDWSSNSDNKTKTDILLAANGDFIAFGDSALDKYTRLDDDIYSDDDDEGDEDDEEENDDDDEKKSQQQRPSQDEIQRRLLRKLQKKRMLFESFKMALYEQTSYGAADGDIRGQLPCQDGTRTYPTQRVFIEALKYIKSYVLEMFQKKEIALPNGIDDIQWLLTVPAIWSDRAKHKMEAWSIRAKLINRNIYNHLRIVYEPDCASISCQSESAFKTGERYILIDAGGGTVDIACHQVKAEYAMEEIYHPTGGPWGSDYIDTHFEGLLCEVFGSDTLRPFKEFRNSAFIAVKDNFRRAKMTFFNDENAKFHRMKISNDFIDAMVHFSSTKFASIHGTEDDDLDDINEQFEKMVNAATPFGLNAGEHLKFDDEYLLLSLEIWTKHLFDRVLNPTIAHVQELIGKIEKVADTSGEIKPLRYLCVAGGLASSAYFQHRVRTAFGKGTKYDLSIRIPRTPILSVIDGALRLGLKPNYIKTRRVKYSYGIAVDRRLENVDVNKIPKEYLERNTYTQKSTGRQTVRNLFSAFIKKNEAVEFNSVIEKTYRRFGRNEDVVTLSIFFSDQDDPYYIPENQSPLASVPVPFPPNYKGLSFTVHFFFGDTTIKAKASYKSNENDDSEEVIFENLDVKYNDLT